MNPKDIMVDLRVYLQRDGTISLTRDFPNGNVASDKIVAMGMLEAAKGMVFSEMKPGPTPAQPEVKP